MALVTGASGGIGQAVSLRLARDGFGLVIHYHTRRDVAEKVRDRVVAGGGEAVVRGFDVANAEEVETAIRDLMASEGPVRVLVNNAATVRDHLLMRMPHDAWRTVIETNLTGVYHCTRAVVRGMAGKRHPGRRIINITSVVGEMGNIGQANYAAAKAGLIGFTKALARELAPLGITVNAVSPGLIATEMTGPLPLEKLTTRIPMGRVGQPEDVAHVVSFLASEEAAYITGQVIRVNGGLLM